MAIPAQALQTHIQGLREAKAAFQALPVLMRERLGAATEATVQAIARQAQSRIQSNPSIQTRTLYNAIGWSYTKSNGRGKAGIKNVTTSITVGGKKLRIKGILRAGRGGSALTSAGTKLMKPSKYGPKVEFGTKFMPAEPFMMPAARSQEKPYLDRCLRAGKEVEKDVAAIGQRNL